MEPPDQATLSIRDEAKESEILTANTQNTPNLACLPNELFEMITRDLNPVDLAMLRCTNRKLRYFIEPGEYTKCLRWAIMALLEHDIDVEKADMLACCACKTKHPRSEFLPSDLELPLDICKVNYKSEGRMCVSRAMSTLFGYSENTRKSIIERLMGRCPFNPSRNAPNIPQRQTRQLSRTNTRTSTAPCSRTRKPSRDSPCWGDIVGIQTEVRINCEKKYACGHCMRIKRKCECYKVHLPGWPTERDGCNVCADYVSVPFYRYTPTSPLSYGDILILYRPWHRLYSDAISLPALWVGADGHHRELYYWRAEWRTKYVHNMISRFFAYNGEPLNFTDHIVIGLD